VDAIRFAQDYNSLSQRQKGGWLDMAYMEEHADVYEGLSQADKAANLAEDKDEQRAFKSQLGRATTARNRFLQLFMQVCGACCANLTCLCDRLLAVWGHDDLGPCVELASYAEQPIP
jgi:hypothetical protein